MRDLNIKNIFQDFFYSSTSSRLSLKKMFDLSDSVNIVLLLDEFFLYIFNNFDFEKIYLFINKILDILMVVIGKFEAVQFKKYLLFFIHLYVIGYYRFIKELGDGFKLEYLFRFIKSLIGIVCLNNVKEKNYLKNMLKFDYRKDFIYLKDFFSEEQTSTVIINKSSCYSSEEKDYLDQILSIN